MFVLSLLLSISLDLAPDAAGIAYKQPRLAADGRDVLMTFGAGSTVYFARSTDRGATFSKPVAVSEWGKLALGMRRGPRIVATASGPLITAIVGQQGGGRDGDIIAWRPVDGGRTWGNNFRVNDVAGSAREGLHDIAASGNFVVAVWLDLRNERTQLYAGTSADGGANWSANRPIHEGSICECCHPTVAIDAQGTVHVMFRNSLDGARDIYSMRSTDRGKTFTAATKSGEGTWMLNACPMDGGAIDTATGKTIWRRDGEIFVAGQSGKETRVATGKDPVAAGGTIVWQARDGLRQLEPPRLLDADGRSPQLLRLADGAVLAAWESKGVIKTERLVAAP